MIELSPLCGGDKNICYDKTGKNEVIEVLKGKFSQYNNFYITDTESLTVEQVSKLRRHCFNKQVEMKVAKNTLIRKALERIDSEKNIQAVYDSLQSNSFDVQRKSKAIRLLSSAASAKATMKSRFWAAFINGDVFVGDNQLKALTQIKTKMNSVGEIIGFMQSPIQRVLGAPE